MVVYLVRHGQTTSDIEDRYGGDYEDHLTDEGIAQVTKAAEKLKDKGIQMIFVSSRVRAQESAKIISEKTGAKIEIEPDLRERNQYGILTGMVKAEARQKYPKEAEEAGNPLNTIKGAEDFENFKKRVISVFEKITKKKDLTTIAIVTHGGPIRRIFSKIKNLPDNTDISLQDCATIKIETDEQGKRILETEGVVVSSK